MSENPATDATVATANHKIAISAVVNRADGSVEDLGVVSHHHSNPHIHALLEKIRDLGGRVDESDVINPHN